MPKKVLLVTSGIFHPPLQGRKALRQALRPLVDFDFTESRSLEKTAGDWSEYSALVLYYHQRTISTQTLDRLVSFADRGGGILALHSATASFKTSLPYFKILGGRFIGHAAVEKIPVTRTNDSIFFGIDDFLIQDELYFHELQPGIDTHFITAQPGCPQVPLVWTHSFGKGKICYVMPGHTPTSLVHPAVQEILRRGLQWVCA